MNEECLLSVEEFGLALLLVGETAMVQAWLQAHGIEWNESVMRERFSAAAHSLITRDLACLDSNRSLILDDSLRQMLREAAHPLYSLSFACVTESEEERWVFHVGQDGVVSQKVKRGGGYRLERMPFSLETLHSQAVTFFRISPAFAVHETRELSIEEFENPQADSGLSSSLYKLIEDRHHERFRGSLIRIDYHETGPASDFGCLVLGSEERTWLFRLLPTERKIRVCSSSPEGLKEELLLLIERRYR